MWRCFSYNAGLESGSFFHKIAVNAHTATVSRRQIKKGESYLNLVPVHWFFNVDNNLKAVISLNMKCVNAASIFYRASLWKESL